MYIYIQCEELFLAMYKVTLRKCFHSVLGRLISTGVADP